MLDLDMGDIYDFAPIVAFFLWTFVFTPLLPEDQRRILGPLGMVIPIVFMILLEQSLKWMASEYTHILAICRPSNVQLDLFINFKQSLEIKPGLFSTKLTLGQQVKHPYWQILEYLVIKHWNTWEDRIEYTKRKVKFKGEWVTHNKSAVVTLYEETTSDIDHLNPVPTFLLTEAPKDVYDPADRYREIVAPMLAANGGGLGQGLSEDQWFDLEKLQKRNIDLESENVELERQALDKHNKWIKGERVIKHLKNELFGFMSGESEQKPAVIEQVLTALEAHTKIREALRELRGPWGFLNKTLVFGALIIVGIIIFVVNPDPIMYWVAQGEIQGLLLILAVIGGVVYYYSKRK